MTHSSHQPSRSSPRGWAHPGSKPTAPQRSVRRRAPTSCWVPQAVGPALALPEEQLAQALARVEARIANLQALYQRILDFRTACADAPTPAAELVHLFVLDPRRVAVKSPSDASC